MEKIKFFQIVIPDNPASMEYAEISRKSYEPVSDLIEIIPFDAITPYHEDFEEHQSKYNWQRSLMIGDHRKGGLQHLDKPPHSPSERAGMCSHWELMRVRGTVDERFWILEHDSYLHPEHENIFRYLVDIAEKRDLHYANIGLFMGCYSYSREFASWSHKLMTHSQFPINGGPYGCVERLYKTFHEHHWKKRPDYKDREYGFCHPWGGCHSLRFGKTKEDMHETYNKWADKARPDKPADYWIPTPTTQVIKKDLMVTQEHTEYMDLHKEKPWTRHRLFKVID